MNRQPIVVKHPRQTPCGSSNLEKLLFPDYQNSARRTTCCISIIVPVAVISKLMVFCDALDSLGYFRRIGARTVEKSSRADERAKHFRQNTGCSGRIERHLLDSSEECPRIDLLLVMVLSVKGTEPKHLCISFQVILLLLLLPLFLQLFPFSSAHVQSGKMRNFNSIHVMLICLLS